MEEQITEATTPEVSPAAEGVNEPEPAAPVEQTKEENAKFAAQRREREQQEKESKYFRELMGDTVNPNTGKPFENGAEFIAWREAAQTAQRAQEAQMTTEQYQEMERRMREDIKANDPDIAAQAAELERLRQREMEAQFDTDFKAIKKAYPDEKAKSIYDMPDDFFNLCANGIDPMVAYVACRETKAKQAPVPPSMGDVKTASGEEKGYLTEAEVRKMSQAEVHKNWDLIMKSRPKW